MTLRPLITYLFGERNARNFYDKKERAKELQDYAKARWGTWVALRPGEKITHILVTKGGGK